MSWKSPRQGSLQARLDPGPQDVGPSSSERLPYARTGCPCPGSKWLQQLQTVHRARVEAWERPAVHASRGPPGSGLLPRNGSGHSTVPEPSAEAKRISHRTCCRPPLELRGREGSAPLKPHGLGMRGGRFLKGHRGYQEESKWLLGAKLQVNHSTHPTEGAEDSACWSTDASGRDVSPPTTAVTSGHRPQRAPRLISRWPRTV